MNSNSWANTRNGLKHPILSQVCHLQITDRMDKHLQHTKTIFSLGGSSHSSASLAKPLALVMKALMSTELLQTTYTLTAIAISTGTRLRALTSAACSYLETHHSSVTLHQVSEVTLSQISMRDWAVAYAWNLSSSQRTVSTCLQSLCVLVLHRVR